MVKNGDVDTLANGLLRLMTDEGLRTRYARAAQQNAQRFRMEQIANTWKQLFDEMTNRK